MSDPSPRPDSALEPGRRIGRYEVISLLARGGMGAVYLARSAGVGGFSRLFAIKVMHPHLADEEDFVHMLVDEARVASRIHHPNAVGILDFDDSEFGYYLVMDYIEGVNLRKVRSSKVLTGEDQTKIGVRMILDALQGLHAAHELADDDGKPLGIVHRDVSPHNILVGADGIGRITDFGIALASSRIASSRPGIIKGKPQYMAPEQMLGTPVDRRADVFCAGIVLWEFLARRRLFVAETEAAMMLGVLQDTIEPPSRSFPLPAGFDEVCARALDRDPERRYPTARAFAEALSAVIDEAGWAINPHGVAEKVGAAFADEISRRKALVRERLTATEDVISNSLVRRPQVSSGSGDVQDEGAGRVSSVPTRASGPSGARSVDRAEAPSEAVPSSVVPEGPLVGAADPRAPASPRRSLTVAVLAALIVSGAVLGVARIVGGSGDRSSNPAVEVPAASAQRPSFEPVGPAPDPDRVARAIVTAIAGDASVNGSGATRSADEPDHGPARVEGGDASSGAAVTESQRSPRVRPVRAAITRRGDAGAAGASSPPMLETNPYLRH